MATVPKKLQASRGVSSTPPPDLLCREPGGAEHFVQFYSSDDFLVNSLAGYISAGLDAGDACLVIATPAHRDALERRLRADGCDLAVAAARGDYLALDALATLSRFMEDGAPSLARFTSVVGSILARVAQGGRHARVFGEMVALLWAQGNPAAAIRLEELWNELLETAGPFLLSCAYPMSGFAGETYGEQFSDICQRHSRVIPDESYTALVGRDERLRAITLLQQKATSLETEVAERQAAEERLRISENRYRGLFEASRDGILIVDPDVQVIIGANPAAAELLGCTDERLRGQALGSIGLFPDAQAAANLVCALQERPAVRYETLSLRTVDDQLREVELVSNRFRANGHDIIQCNLRDVTERRQLERRTQEALSALLALARAAVETPHAPATTNALRADPAHTALDQRAQAERSVAHRLAELTCQVLGCRRVGITAVEPGTERLRAAAVVGLASEEEPGWWAERRAAEQRGARLGEGADPADVARFRAGEILILDMTAPPYRDLPNPYGVITSLVAPMRIGEQVLGILSLDYGGHTAHTFTAEEIALAGAVSQLGTLILERERLLAERTAAQASALALAAANQRMNEFLSVVSHELRTPLTVIMANLQLLTRPGRESGGDDGARERMLLGRSQHQAARLARLVEDMVDLARIREGRLELRPQRCDLAAIVREEVELQRHAHPTRDIRLDLPAHSAISVSADADRIGQVVSNYLTNALKYSAASRPVAVSVALEDAMARVSVRDEGSGIPAEERERVWDIFHRVPGVEVRSGSGVGLGLGLHIARTIVERHGGAVGVESVPGQGSTFWFTIPLA